VINKIVNINGYKITHFLGGNMKKFIACIISLFLMTIIIFINKAPIEALVTYTVTSDVYAAQSSSYTIKIPKKISLSGNDGTAVYGISLKGNISGTDVISVVPNENFIMSQRGKDDVIANITQDKTDFTYAMGVRPDVDVVYVGNINMESISAGKWYGTFNFDIYSSIEITKDSISSSTSDIYGDNILGRDDEQNKTTEYKELLYYHYHDFVENQTKEPNCTEDGYIKHVCSSCGTVHLDIIDETGHSYITTVIESTCCDGGYTLHECTLCGHLYIDNYTNPLGHQYNEQSGICGDCGESQAGVYDSNGLLQSWEKLVNNNILAVDENGVLYNPNSTESFILSNNMHEKLIIDSGVKVIKERTFDTCVSLKEVVMPDTIVEIEPYAFVQCSSLKNVEFSNNLVKIGEGAFERCTTLDEVKLPSSVEQIDERTFFACSSLKNVDMSDCKVTKLKESTFENCNTLLNILFPECLVSIENRVFYNCSSLTIVTTGLNVSVIGESAFESCASLVEFNILNGNFSYIGKDAFKNSHILGKVLLKGIVFEDRDEFNNFVYQSGLSHTSKIWYMQ